MKLALVVAPLMAEAKSFHGLKKSSFKHEDIVTGPTALELVGDAEMPAHFDWRNVNGRNMVTADVNQHIPQYCGACWIHGTVAQLNDRIKVMRNGAWPDAMLARQTLLNCVPGENDTAPPGCLGGTSEMIYDYMRETKIPDETCNVWKAKQDKCEAENFCRNCDLPDGLLETLQSGGDASKFDMTIGCKAISNFYGYGVGDYGFFRGPEDNSPPPASQVREMMMEIFARGPISCFMDATDDFMLNYTEIVTQHEGVFYTPGVVHNNTDHIIELVGWGETSSGLQYWICRNSWGTYWGEGGWFKVARGLNQNLIESECTWAVPTAGDLDPLLKGKVLGNYHQGVMPLVKPMPGFQPALSDRDVAVALEASPRDSTLVALVSAAASSLVTLLAVRLAPQGPRSQPLLG